MIETYHPVIVKLVTLINHHPGYHQKFIEAIDSVKKYRLDEFNTITSMDDWLEWLNKYLTWVPEGDNMIDSKLLMIHFVLNQPSLCDVKPVHRWLVSYAKALGDFLDSPASLTKKSLATFYKDKKYRLSEYQTCPSGWQTFNQFFARHVKPGYRPVDDIHDDRVIVSVADSKFKGFWDIDDNSTITVKNIEWSIDELLQDTEIGADYFRGGIFMHAYLSPTDYHRLHVPTSGRVLVSKTISGNVYAEAIVRRNKLTHRRRLGSADGVGYQFTQTRGVLLYETSYGIIAILPVGMSMVSSVVMTAEKGVYLNKGDEFAYFQFGGSDYIMVFPKSMNVQLTARINTHYDQGRAIGLI